MRAFADFPRASLTTFARFRALAPSNAVVYLLLTFPCGTLKARSRRSFRSRYALRVNDANERLPPSRGRDARWNSGMSPSSGRLESRRRRAESYILTPVSIPKVHHIIRLALAIIMNISGRRISIYVKHARFHGVSRCHRDNEGAMRSRTIVLVSRRYTCTVAARAH